MNFELQHADIPQPKFEVQAFDPERADDWVMPPVKRWQPKTDIDRMCEEALERLGVQLESQCAWDALIIECRFELSADRLGLPWRRRWPFGYDDQLTVPGHVD